MYNSASKKPVFINTVNFKKEKVCSKIELYHGTKKEENIIVDIASA